jgi:hypothetical protein
LLGQLPQPKKQLNQRLARKTSQNQKNKETKPSKNKNFKNTW